MDDGAGHAALDRLVEEHRVEHVPRLRLEAEGHVGQAEDDLAVRQFLGDHLDGVERICRQLAVVLVAGADGEGQRVDQQVGRRQAVLHAGEVVEPLGDAQLALGILGHALLVDGQRDHRRAEAPRQFQALGGRFLAVLEVDGVDDRLAAVELERGLEHAQLGRIEDQRRGHRAAHPRHHLDHVRDLVASHIGGADVEGVRAFADLLAAHGDAAVPVLGVLEVAELLGAVGVAALADREERVLLAQRDLRIERGHRRHPVHRAPHRRRAVVPRRRVLAQHGVQRRDVRRVGAAAAADDVDAVLLDEAGLPLGQLVGAQRIVGLAVDQLGQAGVGLHRDQARPVLGQPFDVLGHLLRAGRAVEPQQIDAEGMDGGGGGRDVGTDQQRAGGLDRHLHEDRLARARRGARLLGAVDGGLDLQRVLAGLDEDGIDAAGDQPRALDGQGRLERVVVDMAEARQLGAGTDVAEHEARPPVGEHLGRLAGQFARPLAQFEGLVGDVELAQRHRRGAEGIGDDHVRAGFQVAGVDLAHQVGPRAGEDVGAVLLAEEVALDVEIRRLDARAEAAVAEQHLVLQGFEKRGHVSPFPRWFAVRA